LLPQITNLVFAYQFSNESQRHYIHNGHAKSRYYDWCIGRLLDGGSLKVIPNDTAYHKGSCQKVTPLQEQTKCTVERKKLYGFDTVVGLRGFQFSNFPVVGDYYYILDLLSSFFSMYYSPVKII